MHSQHYFKAILRSKKDNFAQNSHLTLPIFNVKLYLFYQKARCKVPTHLSPAEPLKGLSRS